MTQMFLEVRGDIGSRLKFWYSEKSGKAVCTFGIKHRSSYFGQWEDRWFSFFAYDEMAEYIAQHYSLGSTIHILKALPGADKYKCSDGHIIRSITWFIREIADPRDPSEGVEWQNDPEVTVSEFIAEAEESDK